MDLLLPGTAPFFVMTKAVGSRCNLRCTYCYYTEKKRFYEDRGVHDMSDEVLEHFVREYIRSQPVGEVTFTWHGGEALLRPLSFYEKVMELQRKYGSGYQIANCIQTNGTLLNDEWCRFFRRNDWLVGLSVDGPADDHDRFRKTASGGASFPQVMRGIERLVQHRVAWNILAVVHAYNADRPAETYRFLKGLGTPFLQFTPVVERFRADGGLAAGNERGGKIADYSVTPAQWGRFLCEVFDEWVREDVARVYVQTFDATLANWVGADPAVCTLAPYCGNAVALEFNGDVYACDHFVFPEYRLGNLRDHSLIDMVFSPQQQQFGRNKREALPAQCKACRFLFACNGECPRNRFSESESGEPGLNYLCSGYYRFFEHAAPYMAFMKRELDGGRPPANIMKALRNGVIQ